MKKTMLTHRTLDRFEEEYKTENYTDAELENIELAAYVANMNRSNHPEWTESDIFTDFLRVLKIHKITANKKKNKSSCMSQNRAFAVAVEIKPHYINFSGSYTAQVFNDEDHARRTGYRPTVYHDQYGYVIWEYRPECLGIERKYYNLKYAVVLPL